MRAIDVARISVPALGLTVIVGCKAAPAPQEAPRPVRVAVAAAETPPSDLRYSASIQARAVVALAFKAGGYVREIRQVGDGDGVPRDLQQGDAVRHGTILARLDPAEFLQRVDQATAQKSECVASAVRARADAERADRLYATASLTRPEYDASMASRAVAEARLAAADAQLSSAQLVLHDSILTAPMDAVILSRSIETGSLAGVGTVAFELADVSRVKAVFGVPDRVADGLVIGQTLTTTVDGADYPGLVSAIAPSAESRSRLFDVEVSIGNPQKKLKPGMVAPVTVREVPANRSHTGGPTVPLSSIAKSPDGAYAVFVVDAAGERARARQRRVSLGEIVGGRISVVQGLAPGESVVDGGVALLVDGEPVHVIP